MPDSMKMDALIFDMDGLMFDTEPLSKAGWMQVLGEQGFALTDEQYSKIIGLSRRHANEILEEMFGAGLVADDAYIEKEERIMALVKANGLPMKPGLLEMLEWAKERALPCAVASSSDRARVDYCLEASRLQEYFDVRTGGDEVISGKPAPDIFLETALRLGVPSATCVVLEDSIPGVLAGLSAGMTVIRVPDALSSNAGSTPEGSLEVESLSAAIPILEGLRSRNSS